MKEPFEKELRGDPTAADEPDSYGSPSEQAKRRITYRLSMCQREFGVVAQASKPIGITSGLVVVAEKSAWLATGSVFASELP